VFGIHVFFFIITHLYSLSESIHITVAVEIALLKDLSTVSDRSHSHYAQETVMCQEDARWPCD
jgi:predicted cation transporter